MPTADKVVFLAEALRDLLGILRVMYAEEVSREHHSKTRVERIVAIANELKQVLATMTAHDPGTPPYERAVGKVDWVLGQMNGLFTEPERMPELLRVASRRVRGEWKPWKLAERKIK
jgi:hypothetical protein